jgi:hypothetical protein
MQWKKFNFPDESYKPKWYLICVTLGNTRYSPGLVVGNLTTQTPNVEYNDTGPGCSVIFVTSKIRE